MILARSGVGVSRRTRLFEELAARVPAKLVDRPSAPIAVELDQFAIREPGRRSVALDHDGLHRRVLRTTSETSTTAVCSSVSAGRRRVRSRPARRRAGPCTCRHDGRRPRRAAPAVADTPDLLLRGEVGTVRVEKLGWHGRCRGRRSGGPCRGFRPQSIRDGECGEDADGGHNEPGQGHPSPHAPNDTRESATRLGRSSPLRSARRRSGDRRPVPGQPRSALPRRDRPRCGRAAPSVRRSRHQIHPRDDEHDSFTPHG